MDEALRILTELMSDDRAVAGMPDALYREALELVASPKVDPKPPMTSSEELRARSARAQRVTDALNEPWVQPLKYRVSILTEADGPGWHSWSLYVEFCGRGRWRITDGMEPAPALSDRDQWDWETGDRRDDDEWLSHHRFGFMEAVHRAKQAVRRVVVNGKTAADIRAQSSLGRQQEIAAHYGHTHVMFDDTSDEAGLIAAGRLYMARQYGLEQHPRAMDNERDPHHCWVCGKVVDPAEAHTYHVEGCPCRAEDSSPDDCIEASGCGEDVHEEHCPTCHTELERGLEQ